MMNNKSAFSTLAVALLAVTVLAGCHEQGDDDPNATGGPSPSPGEGPLRIGLLMPLTGDAAGLGVPAANAARLAVEEINDAGGIGGRNVVLVEGDSKWPSQTEPVAELERMIGQGVEFVVGDLASDSSEAAKPRANDAQVVLLSPSSTRPTLTGPDHGFFFRVIANDTVQGPQAAQFLYEDLGEENLIVMYHQTGYATGLKDEFVAAFEGSIVGEPIAYGNDVSTYDARAQEASDRNADFLWIAGQTPHIANMIKSLRGQGYTGGIMASEAIEDDEIFGIACGEVNGVIFTKAAPEESERLDTFDAAYEARWNEAPGVYSTFAYDAVYVGKAAIEAAGNDGPAIRDWLQTNPVSDRVTTETIRFNANGDITTGGYTLWEIECSGGSGQFVRHSP